MKKKIHPNYHNISLTMAKLYLQNNDYRNAKSILDKIRTMIKNKKRMPTKIKKETKRLLEYIRDNRSKKT